MNNRWRTRNRYVKKKVREQIDAYHMTNGAHYKEYYNNGKSTRISLLVKNKYSRRYIINRKKIRFKIYDKPLSVIKQAEYWRSGLNQDTELFDQMILFAQNRNMTKDSYQSLRMLEQKFKDILEEDMKLHYNTELTTFDIFLQPPSFLHNIKED